MNSSDAAPSAENDVCRCVPDDEVTARDADAGKPLEYVRVPGFWGWFRSGWQEVACPVHDGHASPFSCSRCNPLDCACGCHRPIPPGEKETR